MISDTSRVYQPVKDSMAFQLKRPSAPNLLLRIFKSLLDLPHSVARRPIFFASTRSFKRRTSLERLMESRNILRAIGGADIFLKTSENVKLYGMYFDFNKCREALIQKGARIETRTGADGSVQDVAYLDTKESHHLVSSMGVTIHEDESQGRSYILLGTAKNKQRITQSAVLISTGSGHLFEFRRKTIGNFLFTYGMNVLVYHYEQCGDSEGEITETSSYNDIETAYRYLKTEKHFQDEKILVYGHCIGSGPSLHLAAQHQDLNVLIDRGFTNVRHLASNRTATLLRIPRPLHFFVSWVGPLLGHYFQYKNDEKIQKVRGHLGISIAQHDHLMPQNFAAKLFQNAQAAKSKTGFIIAQNHDKNISDDPVTKVVLEAFLKRANLV